eukprot:3940823-Rhodomonas_salina.3
MAYTAVFVSVSVRQRIWLDSSTQSSWSVSYLGAHLRVSTQLCAHVFPIPVVRLRVSQCSVYAHLIPVPVLVDTGPGTEPVSTQVQQVRASEHANVGSELENSVTSLYADAARYRLLLPPYALPSTDV